jgi:hypothetical protein
MQIRLDPVHADIGDNAARRDNLLAGDEKLAGTPTASIAVSTPRPPVIFMICSTALPSLLLMTVVAPNRDEICRRLSSMSTMMICAGE